MSTHQTNSCSNKRPPWLHILMLVINIGILTMQTGMYTSNNFQIIIIQTSVGILSRPKQQKFPSKSRESFMTHVVFVILQNSTESQRLYSRGSWVTIVFNRIQCLLNVIFQRQTYECKVSALHRPFYEYHSLKAVLNHGNYGSYHICLPSAFMFDDGWWCCVVCSNKEYFLRPQLKFCARTCYIRTGKWVFYHTSVPYKAYSTLFDCI